MGLYISNQWSSHLMEITNDLLIVGLERSVKFSHRSLNSDRFIIGPQHKSLTAELLKTILTGLKFPAEHISDALSWFTKSNQIGLGFEQKNGVSSYRLYFEFFDRYRPDPVMNCGMLHLGYKWCCSDPSDMFVTRYSYVPNFNGNNPGQVVRSMINTLNTIFVDEVVSLTERALAGIPPNKRIMTCAAEKSGCRNSFDVNVYSSKNRVNFVKDELRRIIDFFKIDRRELDAFLDKSGGAALGHISCGMDAMNNPFFTIYFDDFTPVINQSRK